MVKLSGIIASGGASVAALALLLAPAIAATSPQAQKAKRMCAAPSFSGGSFTPAVADPRLAAEFARRGL